MGSYGNRSGLQLVLAWGAVLMLLAAGVAACLLRGLFFAREMYGMAAVWFILCAALMGIRLAAGQGTGQGERRSGAGRGSRRDTAMGEHGGIRWAAMIILGCPLVFVGLYALQLLLSPVSVQGTINELLRWGLYASFACIAFWCAGSRRTARLLAVIWHALGLVLSLSALLAVCGSLPLRYAVAYSASPDVSATGARLGGLLQYPNAFGAVMAAFWLERLFAAASFGAAAAGPAAPGERRPARAAGQLLRMLPLFPYAAALLLSESRGAVLAAALAAAAALLWKRRLAAPLLVSGAAPVAAAALFYRQLAGAGLAVLPWPGLLLLAGCWAGALLAGLWLCRRSRRAAGGSCAGLLLPAALWTAAGTAVLDLVRGRISGPSPTAAARGLFYRDAWRLAGEAPWLGRGGETWHSAYLAAQSRPYVGSQVHSGYLDILLNLGIAGLSILLLMLLAAVWMTARAAPRLLPPLLVIILHGAVDFDWSYGLVWLLLFLLLAIALAEAQPQPQAIVSAGRPVNIPESCPILPVPASPAAASLSTTVGAQPAPTRNASAAKAAHPLDSTPVARIARIKGKYPLDSSAAARIAGMKGKYPLDSPATARIAGMKGKYPLDSPATARITGMKGKYPLDSAPAAQIAEIKRKYPLDSSAAARIARIIGKYPLDSAPTARIARIKGIDRYVSSISSSHPRRLTSASLTVLVLLLICFSLLLSRLSFQLWNAEHLFSRALSTSAAQDRVALLRESLAKNPHDPRAAIILARLLPQEQERELLLRSLPASPDNPGLHWALAMSFMHDNDPEKALYWVRRGLVLDRFNVVKQTEAAEGMLEIGVRNLELGDREAAAASGAAGLALLRQYRLLAVHEAGHGLQHNDRRFAFTEAAGRLNTELQKLLAAASAEDGASPAVSLNTAAERK